MFILQLSEHSQGLKPTTSVYHRNKNSVKSKLFELKLLGSTILLTILIFIAIKINIIITLIAIGMVVQSDILD